MVQNRKAA